MNLRYAVKGEDTEQITVMHWAEWNIREHPELKWLHHCPNGGSRNRAEAVKLKQMGVKAGISDLCLPYPKGIYHGLYVEMKYGDNRQQPSQKEFLADMAINGHYVATCYSADEAITVIEKYLELDDFPRPDASMPGLLMKIPNNSVLKGGKIKEERNVHPGGT